MSGQNRNGVSMAIIERAMRECLGSGEVANAAIWHLSSGGSRVRAHLAIDAAHRANLSQSVATSLATACELLHNASLVHDDLQDHDTHRRGRPALWAKYGKNTAICAGDLMISAAFAALCTLGPKASSAVKLAHRAVAETIRGQAEDLASKPDCKPEQYMAIAKAKSGPLLALPLQLVLLQVAETETTIEAAYITASDVALAYQITDDLTDRDRDLNALSPNACLSLEAAGHSIDGARRHARHLACDALQMAEAASSKLPFGVGCALGVLIGSLQQKILEIPNAA
ncbi:MAG: polyprenyl synthetase family protein [Pseudomonadota bacterium]